MKSILTKKVNIRKMFFYCNKSNVILTIPSLNTYSSYCHIIEAHLFEKPCSRLVPSLLIVSSSQ